jgi:hypothetical protein
VFRGVRQQLSDDAVHAASERFRVLGRIDVKRCVETSAALLVVRDQSGDRIERCFLVGLVFSEEPQHVVKRLHGAHSRFTGPGELSTLFRGVGDVDLARPCGEG